MFEELVRLTGRLHVHLRNEETLVCQDYWFDNLVVTVGKQWIAARMKTAGQPVEMSHMAIGTGATAAVVGDSTLQTEVARVALTTAGGTVALAVVTYAAGFPAGVGTGALTEAGLFNAAAVGTMLCRTVFPVVTKQAADAMTVTWTVTIT